MSLTRQHQRYLDANGDVPGDCWRTALANVMEVPRDEVPHFIHVYADAPDDELGNGAWFVESRAWVERERPGWTLKAYEPTWPFWTVAPEGIPQGVILTGQSPRGDWLHCVVADWTTGELVHDPHPAGGGVLSQVDVVALIRKDWIA